MIAERWTGQKKIIEQESPLYSSTQTNLTAGGSIVQDLLYIKPYDKYAPFNYFRISNQTDKALNLALGDKNIFVPSGVIQAIDGDTVKAFTNFVITSADGTLATGTIAWNWQKVRTLRDVVIERGNL